MQLSVTLRQDIGPLTPHLQIILDNSMTAAADIIKSIHNSANNASSNNHHQSHCLYGY
jgi:hypothetical protein